MKRDRERQRFECNYCGMELTATSRTIDHVKPLSRGGRNHIRNCVPACHTCNRIKKAGTIKQCRTRLLQRKLKWPLFSDAQLQWLRERGFDMSELDNGKLAYEVRGHCYVHPGKHYETPEWWVDRAR